MSHFKEILLQQTPTFIPSGIIRPTIINKKNKTSSKPETDYKRTWGDKLLGIPTRSVEIFHARIECLKK